jgi:hypothetical protein
MSNTTTSQKGPSAADFERPANPHMRALAARQAAVDRILTPAVVEQVLNVVIGLALKGNVPAARLFMQYAVGRPNKCINPDRVELDELQLRYDSANIGKEAELLNTMNMPLHCANRLWWMKGVVDEMRFWDNAKQTVRNVFDGPPSTTAPAPAPDQTVRTAEGDRQQTASSAPAPDQTVRMAAGDRHQTAFSAPAPDQTVRTAAGDRHQTAFSAHDAPVRASGAAVPGSPAVKDGGRVA